ncbi:Alginate export [Sphingopyxis sp. YR583]|uniref:alginate export family protein n=1 Tax=Sphingopyxis sp. YR583 TaxID=1881047 RepID=UPI0008A7EDA6|nr:alginate export family protein [Sphingopyxis sp. YR583]SEH13952.1 Alginate export [Sphingopyxis sp. YR583]
MTRTLILLLALAPAGAARAQDIDLKPLGEARLRYESVDQDGLAANAEALTLRVRAGVEAKAGNWSALVEGQGNLAIIDDYFDGLHGAATRPLVADPDNIALARAQVRYASPTFALTAGRQRLAFDDERFVGTVSFRQNGQSFDAVRAEITPLKGVKADIAYAWSVRTIWGIDGAGSRQQAVSGDNLFGNVGAQTPVGKISAFAYLVDQDEAGMQGFRMSSQSYGARIDGKQTLGKAKVAWQLSYARQSDWHRNPNSYSADYYLADVAVDLGGPRVGAGYEVLGADNGTPLTSFQTPLATGFKYQGWADKFLVTPPDGVRDLYASAGWGWQEVGPLKAVTLQAAYHDYRSDRASRSYGEEIDLLASAKLGKVTASARYAHYDADSFATDTDKFWLQLDWML